MKDLIEKLGRKGESPKTGLTPSLPKGKNSLSRITHYPKNHKENGKGWNEWMEECSRKFKVSKQERIKYHLDYLIGQLIYFPDTRDFILSELPPYLIQKLPPWDYLLIKTIKEMHERKEEIAELSLWEKLNGRVPASYISKFSEGIIKLNHSSIEHSLGRLKQLLSGGL